MCVIVDVNIAPRVFLVTDDPDFGEVHRRLFGAGTQGITLVYGGQLVTEYAKVHEVLKYVVTLDRAGRARRIDDRQIDGEIEVLSRLGVCRSNDLHIIALARVGRTRLLCSHDQALHADFTDPGLLSRPRGKVYQSAAHRSLLNRPCR